MKVITSWKCFSSLEFKSHHVEWVLINQIITDVLSKANTTQEVMDAHLFEFSFLKLSLTFVVSFLDYHLRIVTSKESVFEKHNKVSQNWIICYSLQLFNFQACTYVLMDFLHHEREIYVFNFTLKSMFHLEYIIHIFHFINAYLWSVFFNLHDVCFLQVPT